MMKSGDLDEVFHSVETMVYVRGEWLLLTKRLSVVYHPHFRVFSVESKGLQFEIINPRLIKYPPLPIKVVRCVRCVCLPFGYPSKI